MSLLNNIDPFDYFVRNAGGAAFIDRNRDTVVHLGSEQATSLHLEAFGPAVELNFQTAQGAVELPQGMVVDGKVVVQGIEIGIISLCELAGEDGEFASLKIDFNAASTAALVQQLIRSATYADATPANTFSEGSLAVKMELSATGGQSDLVFLSVGDMVSGTDAGNTFTVSSGDIERGDRLVGFGGEDTLAISLGGATHIDLMSQLSGIEIDSRHDRQRR